jgi:solute carrier family 25 citrate transporter 1
MASSSSSSSSDAPKKKHPLQHLIAGGCAGFVESTICHPLDTIKTRMQLRKNQSGEGVKKAVVKMRSSFAEPALRLKHSLQDPHLLNKVGMRGGLHEPGLKLATAAATASASTLTAADATAAAAASAAARPVAKVTIQPTTPGTVSATLGPFGTARRIVQREGFFALYKGLTAVWTGIIPKMAIRFLSFEQYREVMMNYNSQHAYGWSNNSMTFTAGLLSGLTEAILVVTPSETCKIRMMSQYHSLNDPAQMSKRKYTNVLQTGYTICREEGVGALYKGVVPTMLRQGCNQAVNFTAYNIIKRRVLEWQDTTALAHWQSLAIGGVSGGMGPLVNNPLDVVKTRLQKQVIHPGKTPKYTGLMQAIVVIAREEGPLALWKGITPRLLRIMPGQAITFMTYEAVSAQMNRFGWFDAKA